MGKSKDLATIAADGLSTLKVNEIQNTSGTTLLTNNPPCLRGFYLNPGYTTTTSVVTLTNWTEMSGSNGTTYFGFKPVGAAVNVSSGVFTVAQLGVYRVTANIHYNSNDTNSARWVQIELRHRPNGGSYGSADLYDQNPRSAFSGVSYNNVQRIRYMNFNHANDACTLSVGAEYAQVVRGDSNTIDTYIFFEWVAPPVS